MLKVAKTRQARGDLRVRQHLMGRSFAQSARCKLNGARWKITIQDLLFAAVHYVRILVGYSAEKAKKLRQRAQYISARLNSGLGNSLFTCEILSGFPLARTLSLSIFQFPTRADFPLPPGRSC